MGDVGSRSRCVSIVALRVWMTVLNEIQDRVRDRHREAPRIAQQFVLADEPSLAPRVEFNDGQEVLDIGPKPAVLAPVVADQVGDDRLVPREVRRPLPSI